MANAMAWHGPAYLDDGWAPAPRYLMRRSRILHHLRRLGPGRALEIGSASGALLSELAEDGFDCTGLETSAQALALAQRKNGDAIAFFEKPSDEWREHYDYCMAFEVLEHIEEDAAAIVEWANWLRPGGKLILSVPAHPRLWNARDVWAGHIKRYRRSDLEYVCASAGLRIDALECYGFPLANILEFLIARKYRGITKDDAVKDGYDANNQTAQSGVERSLDVKLFPIYGRLPGSLVLRSMIFLQKLFLRFGLGNGYFVVATKL